MTTITVLTERLPEARKELERLARRAQRASGDDITVRVGEARTERRQVADWDGHTRWVRESVVDLEIEGEAPRVGPWVFLARLEHTSEGVFTDSRPGVEIGPEFRERGPECDHCRNARRRREVYVVENQETGERIQVGRSCLRDHLGIDNPARVAARFRLERQLRELNEGDDWRSGPARWSTEGALVAAATSIRLHGWCSKGAANASEGRLTATADMARLVLAPTTHMSPADLAERRELLEAVSDEDRQLARDTLDWARGIEDGAGDYLANIRVALSVDLFDAKRLGLVVSAVSALLRERGVDLRRETTPRVESQWVGERGERLRGVQVTLEDARLVGCSRFGDVILSKMRDEAGNLLCWFSGSSTEHQVGESFLIDATVKSHDSFRDTRQTILTRVKVRT